ncbi:MAG: hypothetical protein BV456_03970 [Thermoplasmata archaeon M8B2D]|nr:MAG: hypothetical protein BV456_03970 [Thermoplasmata archaeon M8B2D]
MTKICNKCKTKKDISLFNKNVLSKDGYRAQCKSCLAEYRKKNFDKIKKQKQKWYDSNKEHVKQQRAEYRKNNKEKIALMKKDWIQKNPDKVKASYKRNLKKKKDTNYISPWTKSNPEKVREMKRNNKHKRRAKEKEGSITTNELNSWLNSMPKVCEYCRVECKDSYHIEHIEPLSKEGKHELDNLAIACSSCNQSKNAKSLIVWLASN